MESSNILDYFEKSGKVRVPQGSLIPLPLKILAFAIFIAGVTLIFDVVLLGLITIFISLIMLFGTYGRWYELKNNTVKFYLNIFGVKISFSGKQLPSLKLVEIKEITINSGSTFFFIGGTSNSTLYSQVSLIGVNNRRYKLGYLEKNSAIEIGKKLALGLDAELEYCDLYKQKTKIHI